MKIFVLLLLITTSAFASLRQRYYVFDYGGTRQSFSLTYDDVNWQQCWISTYQLQLNYRNAPSRTVNTQNPYLITNLALYSPCTEGLVREILRCLSQMYYNYRNYIRKWDQSSIDYANFLTAFVDTIPYKFDTQNYGIDDYWASPFALLYKGSGDCEDHAMLLASLLAYSHFDTAFIVFEKHAVAGVRTDNDTSNQDKIGGYFPCEATWGNFKCGEISGGMEGKAILVVPMRR